MAGNRSMLVQAPAASFSAFLGTPWAQSWPQHPLSRTPCLNDAGQLTVGRPWKCQAHIHVAMTESVPSRLASPAAPRDAESATWPMLSWLPALISDVRMLWLEIWRFAQRSMAACESGRAPWIQAAVTGQSVIVLILLEAENVCARCCNCPEHCNYPLFLRANRFNRTKSNKSKIAM